MLRRVLAIATEYFNPAKTIKYREGMDGTVADSNINQGMNFRGVPSGVWNSGNSAWGGTSGKHQFGLVAIELSHQLWDQAEFEMFYSKRNRVESLILISNPLRK